MPQASLTLYFRRLIFVSTPVSPLSPDFTSTYRMPRVDSRIDPHIPPPNPDFISPYPIPGAGWPLNELPSVRSLAINTQHVGFDLKQRPVQTQAGEAPKQPNVIGSLFWSWYLLGVLKGERPFPDQALGVLPPPATE